MWRGRSEGDKDDTQGRSGPGQPRSRGNARPGQRGLDGAGAGSRDPRSRATGKKIRRIESGQSTPAQSPTASRRRPSGPGQAPGGRGPGPQGDPTDLGRPPSGPPPRRDPSLDRSGGQPGRGAPSLPPLTQPTGEVPQVPLSASPDDTVVVAAAAPQDGVFGAGKSAVDAAADHMPTALPGRGGKPSAAPDQTGLMAAMAQDRPAAASMPTAPTGPTPQAPPGRDAGPAGGEHAMTDPFPDASSGFSQAAPQTRTIDPRSMSAAAAMGAPVDARTADVGAGRSPRGQAAFDSTQIDAGRPAQRRGGPASGPRTDRPADAASADRLQDTEFKLAGKRQKQKPKEPNKLLLGLAVGLVVLVGVAVAYLLTRGDDGTTTEVADAAPEAGVSTDEETEATALEDTAPAADVPAAEPEPVVDEPTLFFDEAQTAPLQEGETYSIDLVGEPEGSLLQVIVDERPQGSPDAVLPDLILPAGRHSLYIQITNGAEVSSSTPVDVYVLGPEPVLGYRANLSSVDIQTEGWAEAIRQFDEYRAAGHEGLQLAPLTPGYWNIFVGGLGEDRSDASGVTEYCENFGLEVPIDCFGDYYEPTGAGASGGATDDTTDTTVEAMTDTTAAEAMTDDDSSTTVAGG